MTGDARGPHDLEPLLRDAGNPWPSRLAAQSDAGTVAVGPDQPPHLPDRNR